MIVQHNTMGINCEICEDGFFRPSGVSHSSPDACQPCQCDVIGSTGLCFKDDADEHLGIVSQVVEGFVIVLSFFLYSCTPHVTYSCT